MSENITETAAETTEVPQEATEVAFGKYQQMIRDLVESVGIEGSADLYATDDRRAAAVFTLMFINKECTMRMETVVGSEPKMFLAWSDIGWLALDLVVDLLTKGEEEITPPNVITEIRAQMAKVNVLQDLGIPVRCSFEFELDEGKQSAVAPGPLDGLDVEPELDEEELDAADAEN